MATRRKRKFTVGFLGLGKLGLPCILAMESKGHRIMGWDISDEVRGQIERREFPHKEENIEPLIANTKIELREMPHMVEHCDIIFVCVQTPHDKAYEGRTRIPFKTADFDYSALVSTMRALKREAAKQKRRPIVSVISTVLPGTMDARVLPYCRKDLAVCYNPYTPAMGTAINDFLHPEFIILGVEDDDAAETVRGFYATITDAPVRRMSVASAECTKVLYNTQITSKIRNANDAARLCHNTKGANVDDVTRALQAATKRIVSPAYMTAAGLGVQPVEGYDARPRRSP